MRRSTTYISFLRVEDEPPQLPVAYNLPSLIEPSLTDVGGLFRDTPADVERRGGVADVVTLFGEFPCLLDLDKHDVMKESRYRQTTTITLSKKIKTSQLNELD